MSLAVDIKKHKVGDPDLPIPSSKGLKLRARARGSSWLFNYRIKSSIEKRASLSLLIGKYPDLSLDEAVERARDYRKLCDLGIHPRVKEKLEAETKEAQRVADVGNTMTLLELAEDKDKWMDNTIGQANNTKVGRNSALNNFLSPWVNLPFAKITKKMVTDRYLDYQGQGINKPSAGASGVTILKALFNHAIEKLEWDGRNPCRGLGEITTVVPKEENINKYLEADEYKSFMGFVDGIMEPQQHKQIAEEYNLTKTDIGYDRRPLFDVLALELLTGLRMREVLGIERANIFLEEKEWKANKRDGAYFIIKQTKQDRYFAVPITAQMEPIFRRRLKAKNRKGELIKSKYLIPSTKFEKSGRDQPFDSSRSGYKTINKLMSDLSRVKNLHQLVLRHTFATVASRLGYSIDDVDRATGHHSYSRRSATFKHYVGMNADTYRHIFNEVNSTLVGASHADLELVPIVDEYDKAGFEVDDGIKKQEDRIKRYKGNPSKKLADEIHLEDRILKRLGERHIEEADKAERAISDSIIEKRRQIKEKDQK
jgi:integrase